MRKNSGILLIAKYRNIAAWIRCGLRQITLASCLYYYVGCADFVPSNLDPGSQFAVPMFECFDEVLRKASSWVQHQRRVRITNVQSIDYKLKHDYGTVFSHMIGIGLLYCSYQYVMIVSFVA